jgi:hypothetical protein
VESRRLLKFFFQLSKIVSKRGGRVHFQWPTECSWWLIKELQDFFNECGKMILRQTAKPRRKQRALSMREPGTMRKAIPRRELERQSRKSGTKIAIGKLMTIVSWKNAE